MTIVVPYGYVGGVAPFEFLCRAPFTPLSFSCQSFVNNTVDITIPTVFAGQAVDLTHATLYMAIATAPAVLPPKLSIVLSPPLPTYVRLTSAQTTTLSTGKFYYEMEYRDNSGLVATVQTGTITLVPDTT